MALVELGDDNSEEDGNGKSQQYGKDEESEECIDKTPSQPSPGTGSWTSGKKLAVKTLLAFFIPWMLHLIFAVIIYHIEEPHEQKLALEYEKKKADLMILFDKCTNKNASEESECVMFRESWFNMTLNLAQEDPGVIY